MRDSAEPIDIEAAILTIFAHDVTYLKDGLLILVHLSMHVSSMQRVWVRDLEIAEREIHSDCDLHLPALREVV